MALVIADRVQETSTTSGTGTLTLAGAVSGFRTFTASIGSGNTTYYTIYDSIALVWEVGIGTVGSGTLTRTTVLANSSGTTALLNLPGNTVNVWCDYPAGKAVFADTSGNVVLNGGLTISTLSGVIKATTGVISAATAGTDYVAPGGALGTPSSGTLSSCTVDGKSSVGFRNVPQNAQTGNYTLVAADSGKHIYHATGAGAAIYTIPANSSVPDDIGTAITFVNMSTTSISIAIATDTLYRAGAGTTGTRTLVNYGTATALKLTSTTWIISGSGLT